MSRFTWQPLRLFLLSARLAIVLTLLTAGGTAVARGRADVTEAEMKLLPRYCPDTQGFEYGDAYSNTSPRAGYWVSLMGHSFWAMHHYCFALISMSRAQRSGVAPQVRRALWQSALGDLSYVTANSPADFIMLPEIYTRIGEVELQLGNVKKASDAFARARNLKPDYWPAYSRWVEALMGAGQRAEALKVVIQGLENSPNAKVLLEQFRVLGGKPENLPRPVASPAQDDGQSADESDNAVAPHTKSAGE